MSVEVARLWKSCGFLHVSRGFFELFEPRQGQPKSPSGPVLGQTRDGVRFTDRHADGIGSAGHAVFCVEVSAADHIIGGVGPVIKVNGANEPVGFVSGDFEYTGLAN